MLNVGASGMMGEGSKVLFLDAVSGDTRDIPPYLRPAPLAKTQYPCQALEHSVSSSILCIEIYYAVSPDKAYLEFTLPSTLWPLNSHYLPPNAHFLFPNCLHSSFLLFYGFDKTCDASTYAKIENFGCDQTQE